MNSITLAVASHNPVKIRAAEQALQQAFPHHHCLLRSHSVPSDVPEQPMTEAETRLGALNRLKHLQQAEPRADFYVAFEGGYDRLHQQPSTFAFVAVSNGAQTQVGRSAALPLPPKVAEALETGGELGPVMDHLFNQHNIKQKGGAIGVLTNGLLDRAGVYRDTLILLLAPFMHPELFNE